MRVSEKFLRHLRSRLCGHVSASPGTLALYSTDASNYRHIPLAVVVPETTDDLVTAVSECCSAGIPVTIRGAGTSLAGQACNETVVIDCSKHLDRIIRVDPDSMTATVEPGVSAQILDESVAHLGFAFAPDPSTKDVATLGGMYSNNSCGVRSVRYGPTAKNIRSVKGMTADGSEFHFEKPSANNAHLTDECPTSVDPRYPKRHSDLRLSHSVSLAAEVEQEIEARFPDIPRRISGYNLDAFLPKSLDPVTALSGSEGTLVVVTELEVALVPRKEHTCLIVLSFPSIQEAAASVPELLAYDPSGLEAIDAELVDRCKLVGRHIDAIALLPAGTAWLLVEIDGASRDEAKERAETVVREVRDSLVSSDRGVAAIEGSKAEAVWKVRKAALAMATLNPRGVKESVGWEDAAVAPSKLARYLQAFAALKDEYGLTGATFGHFGDGCVHTHLSFDFESERGRERFEKFLDDAADLVVEHRGSLSGEHGDGQARSILLEKMFGPRILDAFFRLKAIWDPEGILNPGRLIDAPPPASNLRLSFPKTLAPKRKGMTFGPMTSAISEEFDRCVGAGLCVRKKLGKDAGSMCPTYMATREERNSTRGRARLLFEMSLGEVVKDGWDNDEVAEALEACIGCKACSAECPAAVDMASYKSEFFYQKYGALGLGRKSLPELLVATSPFWLNATTVAPLRKMLALAARMRRAKRILGVADSEEVPVIAARPLKLRSLQNVQVHRDATEKDSVLLWPDCFTRFFHPSVYECATQVFSALGVKSSSPKPAGLSVFPLCCGRPLIEAGMLGAAKKMLEHVATVLCSPRYEGLPVVFVEPSCLSVFRCELFNLIDRRIASELSARVMSFEEAVVNFSNVEVSGKTKFAAPFAHRRAGGSGNRVSQGPLVSIFLHCHQRSLWGGETDVRMLDALGIKAELVRAGCCGMAGKFGILGAWRSLSMKIYDCQTRGGIESLPADSIVLADGFSCRTRLREMQTRQVMHTVEFLRLDPTKAR